jgi:hypothetical protein
MRRLTRELAEAESAIQAARVRADIAETLRRALVAASHCERAYLIAPDHVKRQINQGFFEKLYINEDGSVEHSELTEPFAALADVAATTITTRLVDFGDAAQTGRATTSVTPRTQNDTPGTRIASGRCLNKDLLVELRGIEPLTFSMRTRRATNCATAPWLCS